MDADYLTLLRYSEPAIQKFGKKTVTARRPLLYGVGSTCLCLTEGSCRYPNTGTYREPHAAYLNNITNQT